MAGAKGKSGGKRAGAGRKPVPKPPEAPVVPNAEEEPLGFLLGVMQGRIECSATQLRAGIAAAQYVHTKRADGGKKDEKTKKAGEMAASSKFAPSAPPKLVHSR